MFEEFFLSGSLDLFVLLSDARGMSCFCQGAIISGPFVFSCAIDERSDLIIFGASVCSLTSLFAPNPSGMDVLRIDVE